MHFIHRRSVNMVYSIDEIKEKLNNVFQKYNLKKAYIFGSYARGEATDTSDVDILIDTADSDIISLIDLSGFRIDCLETLQKEVDVVTVQALEQDDTKQNSYILIKNIMRERIKLYDRERLSNIATYKEG